MADPNTQIDWWIAQAWQEAQGGAENDDLVVWLHENGLTAISSYTILQAALGCKPDEAKSIVFGHPVWAGDVGDLDVANLDYTSDTLEPEPEPDPAFELDDWAEEVEEGPVYGEEGYQPATATGPAESPMPEPEQAFAAVHGLDEPDDFDAEPAWLAEPDAQAFDPAPHPAPIAEDEPVFEPDPPFVATPQEPVVPLETMPPAVEARPLEPALEAVLEARAEYQPTPVMDAPSTSAPSTPAPPAPAPSPFLRTPPSTPAERAAVFAGAFGKKPAAAQTPVLARDTSPAPEAPPSSPSNTEPPSNDVGLAVEAEPAPAQYEPEQPHPAMATAQMPPPLVYKPLPEMEMPTPVVAAEPLFGAAPRDTQSAAPLFPSAEIPRPASDSGARESQDAAAPYGDDAQDDMPAPADADFRDDGESESEIVSDVFDPADTEEPESESESEPEPEPEPEPAGVGSLDDLPPGMRAAMKRDDVESPDVFALSGSERGDDRPSVDRECESHAPDEPDASPSRKPALLDPAGEEADVEGPVSGLGKIPLGNTPEEMARAAQMLGIDFRGSNLAEAGVDPELVQAAKDLGISFRDETDKLGSSQEPDDIALEAQRLGISFRDGGTVSNKIEKPMIVRYMPMILIVVILFFLLLLGATFAGDVIAWWMS